MRAKIELEAERKFKTVELEFPYYTVSDYSDHDYSVEIYTRHWPDHHVEIHENVYSHHQEFEIKTETGHGIYTDSIYQRPGTAKDFDDAWNRMRAFCEKVMALL